MAKEIQKRLRHIQNAYYDGASYKALCVHVYRVAFLITALDQCNSDREVFETFAPLLWGGVSGAMIEQDAIKTALEGPNGPSYLRSWSGMNRVLLANRAAA